MNQLCEVDRQYAAGMRRLGNNFLLSKVLLTTAECQSLLDELPKLTGRAGLVANPSAPNHGAVIESSYRAREWFIDPCSQEFSWLPRKIGSFVTSAIQQLDVGILRLQEQARIIEYCEGGHFAWHPDSSPYFPRDLTISIQLSQPDSYVGGDLLVSHGYGQWAAANRARGLVSIFKAGLFHRVTPVLSGKRHALVLWCYRNQR